MLCPALECDSVHIHAAGDGDVIDAFEADLYVGGKHSTTDPSQHLTAGHGDPWTDLMHSQTVDTKVQRDFFRRYTRVGVILFLSPHEAQYEWPVKRDRDDGPLSLDRLDAHPIQPEYPLCSGQLAGLLDLEIQRRRIGRRRRHVQLKTAVAQIDVPLDLA